MVTGACLEDKPCVKAQERRRRSAWRRAGLVAGLQAGWGPVGGAGEGAGGGGFRLCLRKLRARCSRICSVGTTGSSGRGAATTGGTAGLNYGFQLNCEAREAPELWLESSLPAMLASSLDCSLLPGVLLSAGGAPAQGHTEGQRGGRVESPLFSSFGTPGRPRLGGISCQLFRPYYELLLGHFSRHVLIFRKIFTNFLPPSLHAL